MQVTFTINELKDAIERAATEIFDDQREVQPTKMDELELVLSKETDKLPLTFRFKT